MNTPVMKMAGGPRLGSISGMELLDMWTWWAIWFGPVMGLLAFLKAVVPSEYRHSVMRTVRHWIDSFVPYTFYWIPEFDGSAVNDLYDQVHVYLSSIKVQDADHISLIQHKSSKSITFSLAGSKTLNDSFSGAKLRWSHTEFYTGTGRKTRPPMWANLQGPVEEKRAYKLQVHRADKRRIMDSYLAHMVLKAKETKRQSRQLQIYTNSQGSRGYGRSGLWDKFPFSHPATFATLALDPKLKDNITADLDRFQASEEFYHRVGKAWKRGYLLYGPPGTGKSSMIAAIANKMRYDIYDLELTEVKSNAELRKLLLHTSHKSIIVIEDIDCSLDLSGQRKQSKMSNSHGAQLDPNSSASSASTSTTTRTTMDESLTAAAAAAMGTKKPDESPVTLSGLLNFTDGLWSSCGSERIFIFTTNHIEQLDPALLRTGRMDMHIHMGFISFTAFRVLVQNYLRVQDHHLFPELEIAMEDTHMTPSDVAEVFLKEKDDPDIALQCLLVALKEHKLKASAPSEDDDSQWTDISSPVAANRTHDD